MITSEEIEHAVKESNGNVRDALNKALFKISQQENEIKLLKENIEDILSGHHDTINQIFSSI